MKSMKINKIAAIGLLMVLVIGFGKANGWLSPLEGDVDQEMYIRGGYPKVGDVFEIVYRIRLKEENSLNKHPEKMVAMGYVIHFSSRPMDPVTFITEKEIFVPVLNPGEWREFSAKLRITKGATNIQIQAGIHFKASKSGAHGAMPIYLLNSETGQYGTKEEYEGKLPVGYRYDPMDGSFTCSPSQNPAPVEENRRIIKMIKQFEPALSDSEALLLHSDQYRVGVPKGLPRWDEEKQRWIEEEIFEYYLNDGWFESLQEGRREAWIEKEKKKIENEWKEGRLNFFRPDNSYNRGNNYYPDRFDKDFYGQWWFKDHNYNKDQGLLTTAVKRPIKNGKARLLMTYMYNTVYYRVLTDYHVTDDSGYFCITFDIPQGATGCKAYPIIYPSGPASSVPKVNVSDPNITQPDYWKDSDDQTLFIMRELGVPTYHDFYANAIPCSLGVIWTDTFPQVTQPQSGCINIYETYLHARTFMNLPPTRPLRVMWEPGYTHGTAMNMTFPANDDTIWVKAVQATNTDEWDDDVLLHEFGHYLMKGYAQGPPSDTGGHSWPYEYPDKKGIGYGEGWAHFFSGRARVGSGTDSLIVSTYYGIGGGAPEIWFANLENPWDNTVTIPEYFDGGPWCEGAVAGVLWDIYDSHDEIPYPSYPYPGFPDTALADTLTMGPEEIWDVFDHYNPPGDPTNCWTIFHFRAGWNSYNYGHQFALNQILLHHRIRDSIPAAPTGLMDSLIQREEQYSYYVYLRWDKNSESDLMGYQIFRKTVGFFGTPWAYLDENNDPTDTTYVDVTVSGGTTYRYKVNAFDSLGNVSDYSDSVQVSVSQKDQDKNSPPFVKNSVIKDIRQLVLMVPEGSHVLIVKIYDCTGRVTERQELTFEKGFSGSVNICNRRGENLPSGVYFVDIQNDNDLRVVEKIVIIK